MPYIFRGRGLGAAAAGSIIAGSQVATGFGTSVDCATTAGYWLNPFACWGRSPAAWDQMKQFGQQAASIPLPPAQPAVDAGTSTVPAPYKCSDGSMATAATNCPDYLAALDAAAKAQAAQERQAITDWAAGQAPVDDGSGDTPPGLPWGTIAIVAVVAVLGLAAFGGGAPRRYGR